MGEIETDCYFLVLLACIAALVRVYFFRRYCSCASIRVINLHTEWSRINSTDIPNREYANVTEVNSTFQ